MCHTFGRSADLPCLTLEWDDPGFIIPGIHAGLPTTPSPTVSRQCPVLHGHQPRETKFFLLVGPRGPSPMAKRAARGPPNLGARGPSRGPARGPSEGGRSARGPPPLGEVAARGPSRLYDWAARGPFFF